MTRWESSSGSHTCHQDVWRKSGSAWVTLGIVVCRWIRDSIQVSTSARAIVRKKLCTLHWPSSWKPSGDQGGRVLESGWTVGTTLENMATVTSWLVGLQLSSESPTLAAAFLASSLSVLGESVGGENSRSIGAGGVAFSGSRPAGAWAIWLPLWRWRSRGCKPWTWFCPS